jgi:hypothetical protein
VSAEADTSPHSAMLITNTIFLESISFGIICLLSWDFSFSILVYLGSADVDEAVDDYELYHDRSMG